MNQVILEGYVGQDLELKYTTTGTPYVKVNFATVEKWQEGGEWKKKTQWNVVRIWGKPAEWANNECRKGTRALVVGTLESREWDKQDGSKGYATEVVVRAPHHYFRKLAEPKQKYEQPQLQPQAPQNPASPAPPWSPEPQTSAPEQPRQESVEDDLPF